jgi:SnoaL-like domain
MSIEETSGRAADELAILRLVATVAQSVDDCDVNAYRACFADQVHCIQPDADGVWHWTTVSAAEYAVRSVEAASRMDWTHHQVGHTIITFSGDSASGRVDVVVDMQLTNKNGSVERLTIGGCYDLEFARLETGWKITKRNLVRRYSVGNVAILEQARHTGRQDQSG